MKKSELKTGDQLTFRNGQTAIVLLGTRNGDIFSCIGADGMWGELLELNEDLTHRYVNSYDVVKVSKAETNMRYLHDYETIWEREETPEYVECVDDGKSYTTHSKAEIYGCTNYARKDCENGVVYKVVKECSIDALSGLVSGYVLENNGKHYLISKDGVKPSTKQAYEAQVPEYVELLCDTCGYKKGDIANVVGCTDDSYEVFVPHRESYKPNVLYMKKNTKPSTKQAYEAQVPEYTREQLIEMIGHNFKIKK